jgi:hypothetical protein
VPAVAVEVGHVEAAHICDAHLHQHGPDLQRMPQTSTYRHNLPCRC